MVVNIEWNIVDFQLGEKWVIEFAIGVDPTTKEGFHQLTKYTRQENQFQKGTIILKFQTKSAIVLENYAFDWWTQTVIPQTRHSNSKHYTSILSQSL